MEVTSTFHIVNGDVVGNKIQKLNGEIIVWREMFDMGPIDVSYSYVKRSNYFEELLQIPADLFMQNCREQEEKLELIPHDAEIVLWFEHDRYDQTMLLYLLHKLVGLGLKNLFMVTIDAYPGIEPFISLGQLEQEQLISLYDAKVSLTEEQLLQGVRGWKVYASNDPRLLEAWLSQEPIDLPFVHRAFRAHLTYFPSLKNGLNQVEELALSLIREGIHEFKALFNKLSRSRTDDGISDFQFSALLKALVVGEKPLLSIGDGVLPDFVNQSGDVKIYLTEVGNAVLDGKLDRVAICPINWWLGGVNLGESIWRWDGRKPVQDINT